ncbi:MAG: copper homeostasis protein CutC [Rhodothermales bacterium]
MPRNAPVIIEVCVDSVESAVAAHEAGADRLELNAALELGGLTPPPGLVAEVLAATPLPVVAMVRPRAGDFVYSPAEARVIRRDAEALLAAGVAGLAVGFLSPSGAVDRDLTLAITALAGERDVVFHRAFDITPSLDAALDTLVDLGVRRVLTSGGADSAIAGIPALAGLVERAATRIEVLAGAGINAANVRRLVDETGCTQVHGTFRAPGGASEPIPFGLAAFRVPPAAGSSADEIRKVRRALGPANLADR